MGSNVCFRHWTELGKGQAFSRRGGKTFGQQGLRSDDANS